MSLRKRLRKQRALKARNAINRESETARIARGELKPPKRGASDGTKKETRKPAKKAAAKKGQRAVSKKERRVTAKKKAARR